MAQPAPSLRHASLSAAVCVFLAVLVTPSRGEAQPEFELSWLCPECPLDWPCPEPECAPFARIEGYPFADVAVDAAAELTTRGIPAGAPGAHGWSLSIAADGCFIAFATTDALRDLPETAAGLRDGTGYVRIDRTSDSEPGSPCEGLQGMVAAVVLSLSGEVTLEPSQPHPLLNVALSAEVPSHSEGCSPCRLVYADGCTKGDTVGANRIEYRNLTITPSVNTLDLEICAREDCEDEELNVIVQAEPLGPPGYSFTPYDGLIGASLHDTAEIEALIPVGLMPTATFYAAIVSQDAGRGVKDFSFSISVEGDLLPTDATLEGTAAEVALDGGFVHIELADPEISNSCGEKQGHGITCGVVLQFTDPVTLPPTGTATVLQATLEAHEPQGEVPRESTVDWIDGLRGTGCSVSNRLVVDGETRLACRYQSLSIRSVPSPISAMLRCDPNDDGRSDIADAIWIVNDLFGRGAQAKCREAADCNDDGSVDLSDVVFAIGFQLRGESVPPQPYPNCGLDPDSTPDSCSAGAVTGCR